MKQDMQVARRLGLATAAGALALALAALPVGFDGPSAGFDGQSALAKNGNGGSNAGGRGGGPDSAGASGFGDDVAGGPGRGHGYGRDKHSGDTETADVTDAPGGNGLAKGHAKNGKADISGVEGDEVTGLGHGVTAESFHEFHEGKVTGNLNAYHGLANGNVVNSNAINTGSMMDQLYSAIMESESEDEEMAALAKISNKHSVMEEVVEEEVVEEEVVEEEVVEEEVVEEEVVEEELTEEELVAEEEPVEEEPVEEETTVSTNIVGDMDALEAVHSELKDALADEEAAAEEAAENDEVTEEGTTGEETSEDELTEDGGEDLVEETAETEEEETPTAS